jgi:UMF1 family MFS transporter
MLRDIAPAEKQGLVSGIGQVGNFLGYIFGLAITLPFATGIIYWFGVKGRAQTFLPAAVLFMVVVLPALLFLRNKEEVVSIKTNLKEEFKNYFTSFLKLVKVPGMGRFLLAFFFFNDAVLTAVNNFPIFVDQVFGVSDGIKTIMAVGIFGMAAVGAIAGGLVGDKVGLKKALLFVLSCWVVVFPVVALVKNFIIFSVISCLIGLLYGASLGIARAVMVYLSPKESINHAFSYYNLFERFSTLIGPLAWGLTASMLVNFGPLRYRIAIGVMGLFVFAGLLIVKKIPADKRV